ncbi:hypothetical protein LTR28_009839 [Elasticomyces elasticus]|nr:hypothetical protein LTR28_009839 [Elasticomyces elasticus]
MGKLIRALAKSQEEEERRRLAADPQALAAAAGDQSQPLDPTKLEFCRVLYDFTPEANNAVQGVDLEVRKGDLVAVLGKSDPLGNPSEWWRCRARDGRMGYLPSPYLEPIQRRPAAQQGQITSGSQAGSRAQTMTTATTATTEKTSAPGSRAQTMSMAEREKADVRLAEKRPPDVKGKPGDLSVESFQKGGFYS